jgi:hypothetical protein
LSDLIPFAATKQTLAVTGGTAAYAALAAAVPT